MFDKIRDIFSIPELRQKIFLTLGLLAVYRIGWCIPLPIVDAGAMTSFMKSQEGFTALLSQVAMFSGARYEHITIFGLGIMPYISASIIFQLLATVWKPLEMLQKEGESGRRKINEYTRYATIVICVIQSFGYVAWMTSPAKAQQLIHSSVLNEAGRVPFGWILASVMIMTAGTAFLMWLGEQIDEYGIGNGISLLIMAGILSGIPSAFQTLYARATMDSGAIQLGGQMGVERLIVLGALFVAVVMSVVFVTRGQRRIPTQTAKHVRGRRTFGGNRNYLPLKVNQAGVMPIIFASSLLMFPAILFRVIGATAGTSFLSFGGLWLELDRIFQIGTYTYELCYILLIFFFCYFWTAVTFNPKDMSENLKNYGTFLPGYRPGKRTADYLERVMIRITYVGAGFLAIIAVLPTLVSSQMGIDFAIASFFGGTGLLIAVSVCIDLVDKIDSYLIMRNYKGLLSKASS